MEGDQGGQSTDLVFAEGAQHAGGGGFTVVVPDDQLADHRVVHRGDLGAVDDSGVDAHARARGLAVAGDLAGGGREVLVGLLGVDAALDRPAVDLDVLLLERQLGAGGDLDLLAHDVDAGDHLGHAVLDLDPGVHLEEEVFVAVLHAFDGAGREVTHGAGGVGRDLADALTHLVVDMRPGGLFDDFLVTALD